MEKKEGFTRNPVRIFFALFLIVYTFSCQWELWSGDVFRYNHSQDVQYLNAYEWAAANCKALNITEVDIDTFENGCYWFEGHIRVEGNITVPPLPETTQCDSMVAYNYVQTYGSYLSHNCNELGQHKECHDYNPACSQDFTDVANGFGYRITHGWVPSDHTTSEGWFSSAKMLELEDIMQQSDEWKLAFMNTQPHHLKPAHEISNLLGGGHLSPTNHGFPSADQLNHTHHSNLYIDQALHGGWDERATIPNKVENLKIYDIGKTDGNVIHLNLAMPWDVGYEQVHKWRARMEEVYGDPSEWFDKYGIGSDRGLFWAHRTQTPEDPNREQWRENEAVQILVKQDQYQLLSDQMLFKLAQLTVNDPKSRESPVRTFPKPFVHMMGDVLHAPNSIPDTFYADAELETIRLNGTVPRASPNFAHIGNKIPFYPVIWGPEVLAKLQANGGEFTDAEFKALPEYGSPNLNHFPLAANDTFWPGVDQCPHVLGSYDGPKFAMGSIRITPACRIREPTDKHLDWLGLVHKKNHSETGEPILVWNPIGFSSELTDANVLADRSNPENNKPIAGGGTSLNPLGADLKEFQRREGTHYPHRRIHQAFFDSLLDGGTFYGNSWWNNPLDQPYSTGMVWYYILWHWYPNPFLFEMRIHNDGFDMEQDIKNKAAHQKSVVTSRYYVKLNIRCLLFLAFAWLMLWESKKKRESEESN